MPVHWQEQEKQEVKRHGSSKISNETPSNASLGPPETRLGTADWRAFVREVHLQQKERKVLLMNASYLPNINRYVTFLFYFFAGRVQGPICVDRSSTMIPQPPVKMKSAINNVPSIPMKTPAFVDCKKIVNSFLEPKMRRHLACLLISEEPRIPTRFLAQDPKPSHIDGLPANRPPAADARRFPVTNR